MLPKAYVEQEVNVMKSADFFLPLLWTILSWPSENYLSARQKLLQLQE